MIHKTVNIIQIATESPLPPQKLLCQPWVTWASTV